MMLLQPVSTRTDTLLPDTTLLRCRPAGATAKILAAAVRSVATVAMFGRVGLQTRNSDPRTTTMTEDKIALRALLEKGSDATFLREMIGFAAQDRKSVV